MSENALLVSVEYSQISVAELRDEQLFDFEIEQNNRLVGNIYWGRVETILPGMDAAFVDIGLGRNALIYAGDIGSTGNVGVQSPNLPIEKLLHAGDSVVVQIARAPLGTKGARVTARLSLLGRYIVLAKHSENVGVSRRIENAAERERLRKIVEKLRPLDHSVIVRTEAAGVSEHELAQDVQLLQRHYQRIRHKASQTQQPTLLYREMGLLGRVVRDRLNEKMSRIVVYSNIEYSMLRELVEMTVPHFADRVQLYEGKASLFFSFGLNDDIKALNERVVTLPHGGYLAIDEAEALTAIDVNTGRFVGKSRLADTVLATNLEAATEAARQLRLRNIGGIIVIDFIDMESTRDRVKVMDTLEKALKEDRTRTRIVQLSPLGLVEMTRRRDGDSLRQLITDECPYCDGEGRVQSASSVALECARAIRDTVAQKAPTAVLATLHPLCALDFLGNDCEAVRALETETGALVYVFTSASLHRESRYIEAGQATDFAWPGQKFAIGARFEVSRNAKISDDASFAVTDRVLVRLDDASSQNGNISKALTDCASILVEVVQTKRWFVEVKLLASGEPSAHSA